MILARTLCAVIAVAVNAGPHASAPKRNDTVAAAVHYLDHLRSCTPYTYHYPEPLAHSIGESTIRGKSGDACKVGFLVPNSYYAECAFSAAAIKALTRQAKYREARTGKFNASLSEAEGRKFGSECHWVFYPAPASSPSQVRKP
jgi:hypothetical protein